MPEKEVRPFELQEDECHTRTILSRAQKMMIKAYQLLYFEKKSFSLENTSTKRCKLCVCVRFLYCKCEINVCATIINCFLKVNITLVKIGADN